LNVAGGKRARKLVCWFLFVLAAPHDLSLLGAAAHRTATVRERLFAMYYLITFVRYGSHVHGDYTTAVDKDHNIAGNRFVETESKRASTEREWMDQTPYSLDEGRRAAVLRAIQEVRSFRDWRLVACHARTNHLHTVVDATAKPEKVMADFKVYASRMLNRSGFDSADRKRWARDGSTTWLWTTREVDAPSYMSSAGRVLPWQSL